MHRNHPRSQCFSAACVARQPRSPGNEDGTAIDLSGNTSQLHRFQLRTTLNGMDFKFVSYGLWSEEQNILRQHMHKKEFWILTIKCGNKLKHENEAKGSGSLASFSCLS
jgi:hypothetical protein